ncbi:MAG: hypothetical protein OEV91_08220 [Desulfobulbaceae bacterium]|nr:hypothetical protein [Desulfobulbaceae bacterium]
MRTAKVSDYRSALGKFHRQVLEDHDPLRVSGRDGDVVVLAADDFEALRESVYILRDKVTMQSLLETRKEMAARGVLPGVEVDDAFKDLLGS